MAMENPEGTPLDITTDYFGKPNESYARTISKYKK